MYKITLFSNFHKDYLYVGQFVYDINKKKYGQIIRIESEFDSEIFFVKVGYGHDLYCYSISDLNRLKI